THPLTLCPNSSVTINGMEYTLPGTVYDTISGIQGCDTINAYVIGLAPLDLVFSIDSLYCASGQVSLDYTLCNLGSDSLPPVVPVAFYDADPATDPGANLLDVVNVVLGQWPDSCISLSYTLLNPGGGPVLPDGGTLYSVVNTDGTLPVPFTPSDLEGATSLDECNYENNFDSATLNAPLPPVLDLGPTVILCADSTVVFYAGPGFAAYLWQDGSTGSTFAASDAGIYWVEVTDACGGQQRDSVLLTLSLLPDTQFPDTAICANKSLTLSVPGFDNYAWTPATGLSCTDCPTVTIQPATTTTYTLLATSADGCVLHDTFTVEVLPLPEITEVVEFCPGETITIAGQTFSAPGAVSDTIPNPGNCDIILTYQLQYLTDPNSTVSIVCIDDLNIPTLAGTGPVAVDYDLPTVLSDCPCPGISLTLTEGLPPGSIFPVKKTEVCYEARDSCGNVATCCFNVIVREGLPCDVKEIGCMRYELLQITQNSQLQRKYRIRVINQCADPMTYVAFEVPNGVVAAAPANGSTYIAPPDDRSYLVRNPNFTPFYSIRFKSTTDSIANGETDIFEYTLPPQSQPDYIHVVARLEPQTYNEAYLNTFNCPVMPEQKPANRSLQTGLLHVFPNPTTGVLYADLPAWAGEQVQVQVLDGTGQVVLSQQLVVDAAPQPVLLPAHLPGGLYILTVHAGKGPQQAVRFVVQH
ncbi:MAG: T9SS type A sorting domain-containing protein, partial [Bacteroidetes bacterium]